MSHQHNDVTYFIFSTNIYNVRVKRKYCINLHFNMFQTFSKVVPIFFNVMSTFLLPQMNSQICCITTKKGLVAICCYHPMIFVCQMFGEELKFIEYEQVHEEETLGSIIGIIGGVGKQNFASLLLGTA